MHGVGMMVDASFVPGCATRLGFRPNLPISWTGSAGALIPGIVPAWT